MRAVNGVRISLRELLMLVVFFAIGCLSLKFANTTWLAIYSGVAMLTLMVATVVALVDRGPRQNYAIGFLGCTLIYAAMLRGFDDGGFLAEVNPYTGTLATSRIMLPIFQHIAETVYIDYSTGKVVPKPNLNSSNRSVAQPSSSIAIHSGPQQDAEPISQPVPTTVLAPQLIPPPATGLIDTTIPNQHSFMAVAHYLWAALFGYMGGHFAKYVYARRQYSTNQANPL